MAPLTYPTHFAGGVLFGLTATALFGIRDPATAVALTALSAASAGVPDLDSDESKLGRKCKWLSGALSRTFGHRGLIHTPCLYILISALFAGFVPSVIILGFLTGVISHLALDSFNRMGIAWAYPFSRRRYHWAEIRTRTPEEDVFRLVLWVLSGIMLVVVMGLSF